MYVLLVLACTLAIALWGYISGFFRVMLRLATFLLAYAATWQETPHLAEYLSAQGWLQGLLVWPVASVAVFLGSSVVFSLLARFLVYAAPEHWLVGGKVTGAGFGALLGCGTGLLMAWTIGVLQDTWHMHTAQSAQDNPVVNSADLIKPEESGSDAADKFVRDLAGDAIAALAQRALGDTPAATAATQWVREPMSVSSGLQHLASKPELRALFENPASFAVLVNGGSNEIQRLPAFQAITDDPEIMPFLSVMGLQGETLPEQSTALAELLSRYARNFEKLRTTPEFQSLTQNAELREKLKQGNLIVLLTDEKMRRLAEMLAHGDQLDNLPLATAVRGDDAGTVPDTEKGLSRQQPAPTLDPAPSKPLYRWKDSNGRVHITEEKPSEGVQVDVIVH
jgi:uncharacterized membrane protein required for colicin V production